MIIIPKEKPAIENLNSYYLHIRKLIEHYQGELGAGVVFFKAPSMECALFFDEYQIANGVCEEKKVKTVGREAVERIVKTASKNNFSVSVYAIRPDRLYFWANLSNSEVLYSDLSTEFTDLEGLIRKMEKEKLTGYIDVALSDASKGGLLFFFNGEVIGGVPAAASQRDIDRSPVYKDNLVDQSREYGGKFSVSKISLDSGKGKKTAGSADSKTMDTNDRPAAPKKKKRKKIEGVKEDKKGKGDSSVDTANVLAMLESLLGTLEGLVKTDRKVRQDFETLLNRKFYDKVDKYDFLDPFAAEFRYSEGKVSYTGEAGNETLVSAISECVSELAEDLELTAPLRQALYPWRQEFADEIIEFELRL